MDLPRRLVDRLPFEEAVGEESNRPSNLLPSRVVENAMAADGAAFADQIRSETLAGLPIRPQETVWANKSARHSRPASALAIRERVLYRALTQDAAEGIELKQRTGEEYTEFERAILSDSATKYVVLADVASFYQYIDHRDLEVAIVERAGKADVGRAVRDLLDELMQQSFGIPQGPGPSNVLSELTISPVEQRMLRHGFSVTRYSDDFRIAAQTWGDAVRAVRLLQSELHRVGLAISEGKTSILTRAVYTSHINEVNKRVLAEFDRFQIDLGLVNEYSADDDPDADLDPEIGRAAAALLDSAIKERRDPKRELTGYALAANTKLITLALALMGRARNSDGLPHGPELMADEPWLARFYGPYIARILPWSGWHENNSIPKERPTEVSQAIDAIAARIDTFASPWQTIWVCQGLTHGRVPLTPRLTEWLRLHSATAVTGTLEARAILLLAAHGAITQDDITSRFDAALPAAHPDLVAALHVLDRNTALSAAANSVIQAASGGRQVADFVANWPRTNRWMCMKY